LTSGTGQAPAAAKTARIASSSIPKRDHPPREASGAYVTAAFVPSLSRAIVRLYNLNDRVNFTNA
jgi:ABC-type phosphate transport system substrate-binding protein